MSESSHETSNSTAAPGTETPSVSKTSRLIRVLLLAILLVVVIVWLLPSPIDPVAHTPTPVPEWTGDLAPNEALREAERLAVGEVAGPEDVDVDDEGRLYAGTADGRIVRFDPGGEVETFAETGGRPLGLAFDRSGNLVVADAVRGLLQVSPGGDVTVLATEANGIPLGFTDDVDVAPDGRIYFSDASDRFGVGDEMLDLLEGRPHGRLLRYDPATQETEALLDGLYFANGIAVSRDGQFVLVNETYRHRITRYWLEGPAAGSSDIFADDLPGYPDGVSASPRGTFWVAMFTVRNSSADMLGPRPWLRNLLAKLPRSFWPGPDPYGLVLELDREGNVVRSLHDVGGTHLREVTSAEERGKFLYLGTLHRDYVARLPLQSLGIEGSEDVE